MENAFGRHIIIPNFLKQPCLFSEHIPVGGAMSCIEPSDIYPAGFCLVREEHGEGCVSAAMGVSEDQNFDIYLEPDDELRFRHFSLDVRRSVNLNVCVAFHPLTATDAPLPAHAGDEVRHGEAE